MLSPAKLKAVKGGFVLYLLGLVLIIVECLPQQQSSQQFTLYKQIQVGYGVGSRGNAEGSTDKKLTPVFHYNYNISHNGDQGSPLAVVQNSPGFRTGAGIRGNGVGTITPVSAPAVQSSGKFVDGRDSRRGGYEPRPLLPPPSAQPTKKVTRSSYSPVIIANPSVIRGGPYNPFPHELKASSSENRYAENEPEQIGILTRGKTIHKQSIPLSQQLLSRQEEIRRKLNPNAYTTPRVPVLQVPYVTTPSPLKQIMMLQKNTKNALAGFRTQLGLINPANLQATSLGDLNRDSAINLSPPIRAARVQNFVLPYHQTLRPQTTTTPRPGVNIVVPYTPANTKLLPANPPGQLERTQNAVTNTVFAIQRGINPFLSTNPNLNQHQNQNLQLLNGVAITPENQQRSGQYIFDERRTTSSVYASSAQKLFILPPGPPGARTIPGSDIERRKDASTVRPVGQPSLSGINSNLPTSEIVVTVVDDQPDPLSPEKGKVLTTFSLMLSPQTYNKCTEGFNQSFDRKCKLIIKLRGRSKRQVTPNQDSDDSPVNTKTKTTSSNAKKDPK